MKHDKKYFIEAHRKSHKHQKYLDEKNDKKPNLQQTFLTGTYNAHVEVVVKAFTSANIPLYKLQNPNIIKMFQSFGKPHISESKARLYILQKLKDDTMEKLINYFKHEKIFIEIDESEIRGNKYVNILAGTIRDPNKIYVLNVIQVANLSVDSDLIKTYLDDTLTKFSISLDQILLIITDAARYMIKAFQTLGDVNKSFFHITCLAHLIHNCCMKLKANYTHVDNCIARIKAITIKNKCNAAHFKNIGKPPDVIITRWSSWLNATYYYSENLPAIKDIVESISEDGVMIKRAKEALRSEYLVKELIEIRENYSVFVDVLENFEHSQYDIDTGFKALSHLDLKSDPINLKYYIDKRLKDNGITELLTLTNDGISPADYMHLKKCPATSIAVERSFSMLGKMLDEDRNFKNDNIYYYFSEYFNKFDE